MVKTRSNCASVIVDAVIDALKIQGIAFPGPCWTHNKPTFFVIDQSIFLESEPIDLLEQNKLNRDGIQELVERIKAHSQ